VALLSLLQDTARIKESRAALVQARRTVVARSRSESRETTFLEDGELAVDGGSLRLETVGSGTIEPSAEEGTLRGSVIWKAEGTGRLNGATGLLTSNFEFKPDTGAAVEQQVVRLFLP